jgi:hypothetical protein
MDWYWTVILLIGATFRLYGLLTSNLSLTEFDYIQLSSLPTRDFWSNISQNDNLNPLFAAFLHFWFFIFPSTDWTGRIFPIAIDLLNIILINRIFSNILSPRLGLGIAFFYSVSAFSIFCSQQIEPYTLSLFVTLLSFHLLNNLFSKSRTLFSYLVIIPLLVIGLTLNYLFIFFLCAIVVSNFISLKSSPKTSSISLAFTVLAFLSWITLFQGSNILENLQFQPESFSFTQILYLISRMILGYGVLPLTAPDSNLLMEIVATNFTMIVFVSFVVLIALGLSSWNLIKNKSGGLPKFILPLVFIIWGFCLFTKNTAPFDEPLLLIATPFFFALLSYFPWPSYSQKNILLTVRPAIIGLFILGINQHLLTPDFGKTPWRNAFEVIKNQNENCPNLVMSNDKELALAKFYLGSAWPIYPLERLPKLIQQIEFENPSVCSGFWSIQTGFENQFPTAQLSKINFIVLNEMRFPTGDGLKATYFGPK